MLVRMQQLETQAPYLPVLQELKPRSHFPWNLAVISSEEAEPAAAIFVANTPTKPRAVGFAQLIC